MKFILLIISLFLVGLNSLFSQEYFEEMSPEDSLEFLKKYEMLPRYGAFYHHGFNLHTTSFSGLPNVPSCCPDFTFGSSFGFTFGALYDYPLKEDLHLNFRLAYQNYNADFEETESTNVIVDGFSTLGQFTHRLDADFSSIGIEANASYNAWRDLWVNGGFRAGLNVHSQYSQFERISQPANRGTFQDGRTTRNVNSGDIESVSSLQLGILIGASYKFPLNERNSLFAYPEIFYQFDPISPVQDVSWMVHTVRAGVAVKYKKPLPPPPPPAPPLAPPIPKIPKVEQPKKMYVDVNAVKVDSTGKEQESFSLRIEDFVSLNMRPLLNYVFFDSLSSQLPERYKLISTRETVDFEIDNLKDMDALETYYHVLNIIGLRLRNESSANITLVGTNSNNGGEEGNLELSEARANSVKDYLVNVWKIDENRIDIKSRNLPDKETRSDEPGGDAENRRVEIISNSFKISEPVVTIDTMRVISTSTIRFKPEVKSDRKIIDWELNVENEERLLKKYEEPEQIPENLDWKISNNDENSPQKSGTILYRLKVENDLGQSAQSDVKRLPVEQLTIDKKRLERIKDKEFEYYSLILFDYGKTNLRSEHREVVDLVKNRVTDEAKVYVIGYTDSMGDEEINKRISESRAKSVADRLNIRKAEVQGIGEEELLYDNSTPEGRFYCRTVQIIIETPVEEEIKEYEEIEEE